MFVQQVLQTILGLWWLEPEAQTQAQAQGGAGGIGAALRDVVSIRDVVVFLARSVLRDDGAAPFLRAYGPSTVWFLYWWGIPLAQLVFAMYV